MGAQEYLIRKNGLALPEAYSYNSTLLGTGQGRAMGFPLGHHVGAAKAGLFVATLYGNRLSRKSLRRDMLQKILGNFMFPGHFTEQTVTLWDGAHLAGTS
jgi:hypothetical protein